MTKKPEYVDPLARVIGRNVKLLRASRSKYWLARTTGLQRTSISNIENGRHLPNVRSLWRVAKALGVTLDFLVKPS